MTRLPKIGLGNFIKSSRRIGKNIGEEIDVVYSDLLGINTFLSSYSGFFEATYSDTIIDPNQGGINGETILVSNNIDAGAFYNSAASRPKTVKEVLTDIRKSIDISLGTSNVSTELLTIKDSLGSNIFDEGQESSDLSIDKRIDTLDSKIVQIASDCFNRGQTIGDALDTSLYQISGSGGQTQANSLRDLVERLLETHGGLSDLGHAGILQHTIWPVNLPASSLLGGGQERYAAPFGSGYESFGSAQKFYNPTEVSLRVSKLFIYVDQNTLLDNLTVEVHKNGIPTDMLLHVAGGRTGPAFHVENEVTVDPGDYIQFKIITGVVAQGIAHINNISLTLQEISN